MSSSENNNQTARGDRQQNRFLSLENAKRILKTTVVLSALLLSIWAVVLNQALEPLSNEDTEEKAILVETEGRESDVYCPEGGADIFLGTDFDGNGKLSADEITSSTKVCHGQQGLSGPQGQQGYDGSNGEHGNGSLVNLTAISPGIPCSFGGIQVQSGIDINRNQYLDSEEVQTTAHICDGQLGDDGPIGEQGNNGSQGYSALIDQQPAPTALCSKGVVMRFGVDDGIDRGIAGDGLLHEDEVRESLRICSEQLYQGIVGDLNLGVTNGHSSTCSQISFSNKVLTSGNNGINGCELWMLDVDNTPLLLKDIHSSGDSIPGKILGIQSMETERGLRFVFDADDGIHGRELWVTDGTSSGTLMVGDIETGDGIDYSSEITEWMNGVVFTTNGQQGQRMWWTNGSVTTSIWQAPWLTSSASSDLMNQSVTLSSLGQNMLLGDENRLWFAAKESNIGLEVMQLDSDGTMTMYDLHPFGDSSPSKALVSNNGLVVVAGDGTGRQLAHLDGSGGVQWLTSMTKEGTTTPVTTMAPKFGLHQIGDTILFDAVYRGADATLFSYSFATSNLLELSSTILAPGHSLEPVSNGHTIWFDCVIASTGMELCQTDGTEQGTHLTIDLMQGISSSLPRALMYTDSTLYVLAQGIDQTGTNSGHALWAIDGQTASVVFDPYAGIGNDSSAGTYGGLIASSTHIFFIADDGVHGHELHQYLLPSIQDDWVVWN